MIRFIVDTISSKPDVYGNRYNFATITAAATGRYIKLDHVGGDSNAVHLVRRLTSADWSEIHSTNTTEPIRQFNRMRKFHADGAKYEHQVTRADLKEIEGLPHATQENTP